MRIVGGSKEVPVLRSVSGIVDCDVLSVRKHAPADFIVNDGTGADTVTCGVKAADNLDIPDGILCLQLGRK